MLRKHQIINEIEKKKLIFILRYDNLNEAEEIINNVIKGGIKIIELTMTSPGVLPLLEKLRMKYVDMPDIIFGVGTVLDEVTARLAILSGANFIVAPNYNQDVVRVCNRYGIPIIPGTTNVSEIVTAIEDGVDLIKFFPARSFGPSIIKDIKGPLPQANIIPTGGINLHNLVDWLRAGAFAVGVGRDIYKKGIETQDLSLIEKTAWEYVQAVENSL